MIRRDFFKCLGAALVSLFIFKKSSELDVLKVPEVPMLYPRLCTGLCPRICTGVNHVSLTTNRWDPKPVKMTFHTHGIWCGRAKLIRFGQGHVTTIMDFESACDRNLTYNFDEQKSGVTYQVVPPKGEEDFRCALLVRPGPVENGSHTNKKKS